MAHATSTGSDGSITKQPAAQPGPTFTTEPTPTPSDWYDLDDGTVKRPSIEGIKRKLLTREGWLGDFNYYSLCMPTLPFAIRGKSMTRSTPFYALNDDLPIIIAAVVGFQHSLAMLAGVITPPIIFASQLGFDSSTTNYLVSASLIASGILSAVQMTRFRIPFQRKYYFGTGLITVVGTSFSTLSTGSAIFNALYTDGTCSSTTVDGVTTRNACPAAWGYLLGTSAVCSLIEMLMSFVPPAKLKRIFPPLTTGLVVLLIGLSLIGDSGFLNWAGGAGTCSTRPPNGTFSVCPAEGAPHALPWGSAQYLGLGFLSFVTIIIVELFGSPFMKNASIVMGLIVGMIVAGPAGYVDGTSIREAPVITFLWVHTFPLKVYGPAVLPLIAV